MKDPLVLEAELLEGMPSPRKQKRIAKKKFFSTKHVPLEVGVRRQVAEEIGDAEPTRDEKFILLQKYGVAAPRIDRLVTKPKWMGESTWKRKLNEWSKMTHGLVKGFQPKKRFPQQSQPGEGRPPQKHSRPWRGDKTGRYNSRRPNNSNNSRPNSARVQTGNRPN